MKTYISQIFLIVLVAFFTLDGKGQKESFRLDSNLTEIESKDKIRKYNEMSKSFQTTDSKKSLSFGLKALNLALKYNDKEAEALAYENIGACYVYSKDYQRALECYNQAWTIYDSLGKKKEAASTLNNIGLTKHFMKEYDKALEYFERALKEFEDIKESKSMASIMNNIANVYLKLDKNERALEYYTKALEVKKEVNDNIGVIDGLAKIGLLYKSQNQYSIALRYFNEAIEIPLEGEDTERRAQIYSYIAELHLLLKDNKKALSYLEKSYSSFVQNQEEEGACKVMVTMSKILIEDGGYKDAENKLEQALVMANNLKEMELEKQIYYNYYLLYSKKNDVKKAFEAFKKYSELKEMQLDEEYTLSFIELNKELEDETKKTKMISSDLEKKAEQLMFLDTYAKQLNDKIHNTLLIFLISSTILIIMVIYLIIILSKARKAEQTLIDFQSNYNSELRKLTDKNDVLRNEKEKLLVDNERIKAEKDKLDKINNSHDDLFDIINSTLKKPFVNLMNYSDLMINELHTQNKEDLKKAFFQINKEAAQGLKEVENVMDWSKTKKGKIEWSPQKHAMKELIDDTLMKVRQKAKEKNIKLSSEALGLHKGKAEYGNIFADKSMMETVLKYLVDNAINTCSKNGMINITTDLLDNEFVRISVENDSTIMHPEEAKRLFDISTYQSTPNAKLEGGGLGLVLCKEFVEKNGGEIWVEVVDGKKKIIFTTPRLM